MATQPHRHLAVEPVGVVLVLLLRCGPIKTAVAAARRLVRVSTSLLHSHSRGVKRFFLVDATEISASPSSGPWFAP